MSKAITLYKRYQTRFNNAKINTPERLACFFGRAIAEVGESLLPIRESGYYSTIAGLRNTFVTPFKGKSDGFVKGFVALPKQHQYRLFNYVYANRGGNGNEASGDGNKYRGGGIYQITTKNNWVKLSKDTGIPFYQNPDLILEEANSIIAGIWFWETNKLNQYADKMDIDAVCDIVNIGRLTTKVGDAHGYEKTRIKSNELLVEFRNIM